MSTMPNNIACVAKRPAVTKQQAITLATKLFGLEVPSNAMASMKELNSYDDRNFYMQGTVSDRTNSKLNTSQETGEFILKVMNATFSRPESCLELNSEMLVFINRSGIKCPLPYRSINGSYHVMCRFPGQDVVKGQILHQDDVTVLSGGDVTGDDACAVRLYRFIPGQLFNDIPFTEELFVDLGVKMARLHKVMKEFSTQHPLSHQLTRADFIWNLDNMPEITKAYLHAIDDKGRKDLVEQVSQRFVSEVLPKLNNFEAQLTHGDVNEMNALVEKELHSDKYAISSFIDFSDCRFTQRVMDVGIALAYVMMLPKFESRMCARVGAGHVLAGYQSEWPLSRDEVDLVGVIAAARCCQSLVIGSYENEFLRTDNNYLLKKKSRVGWEALEELVYECGYNGFMINTRS